MSNCFNRSYKLLS